MRKTCKSILCFALLFVSLLFGAGEVSAKNETVDKQQSGLFLITEKVPKRIEDFAISQKEVVFDSLPEVVDDWIKYEDRQLSLAYGEPFVLGDVVYFPILCDKTIIALLGILNCDDLGWTLSEEFSDELNKLSKMTSKSYPVELLTNNGDVFACIDNREIRITNHPNKGLDNNDVKKNKHDLITTNALKKMKGSACRMTITINTKAGAKEKYLDLDRNETQNDEEWCAAFCGAQIMRFKGKNKYAYHLMHWLYPDMKLSDLKKESMSVGELMQYGRENGFNSTHVFYRTMEFKEVKGQIDARLPIYIGAEGYGKWKNARHAFVIRGYNANNNTYSVWNPWYKGYSTLLAKTNNISASGGGFTWDRSIFNWFLG